MLKSSTYIGSKDIRPTMHINDRVLLGRMHVYFYGCIVQVMYRQGRLASKCKYERCTRQCTSLTVSIDIETWKKARVFHLLHQT